MTDPGSAGDSHEASELLNTPALEAWLEATLPSLGTGRLRIEQLTGGSSNAVFRINRGEALSLVLRRPPLQPRPNAEETMAREVRVLRALDNTDVPHPALWGYCPDPSVIGASFYIMDAVDGWVGHGAPRNPPPYDNRESEAYRRLPYALIDGIASLARIDYRQVGLADFGKPDGFLQRQAGRWLSLLESYRKTENYEGRAIPHLSYVSDWLKANTPTTRHIGIVHGDYSLANALFSFSAPPRLLAMIDWELATIGDTMVDVGWTLYGYRGREDRSPPSGFFDSTSFPFREELAEYYEQKSGHKVEHLDYYMILAQFKLAIIMEGHVARAKAGKQRRGLERAAFVDRLMSKAAEMIRARSNP